MADTNQPDRNILGEIARIAVGFGIVAAASALAARKRGAKRDTRPGTRSLDELLRNRPTPRRKPPESGLAVPAVPPRGPLPMQGGAAAPLDFEA
jgi:hypothetical protein